MSDTTNDLAPCPFCGSAADMQDNFGREFWAQCSNLADCGCTNGLVHGSPKEAADFWNRRPTLPQCKGASEEDSGRCPAGPCSSLQPAVSAAIPNAEDSQPSVQPQGGA